MYKIVSEHRLIFNSFVVDLGCGKFNPFGVSAIFYLNGASFTLANDVDFFYQSKEPQPHCII
jgi:hypothetical protein